MIRRKVLHVVVAFVSLTVLALGIRRACCDRVVGTFHLSERREVVVWRSVNLFENDNLYYVVTAGSTGEGPFYIGPVFGSSPSLEAAMINQDAICIYNRDRPDDVYCFADYGNQLYYPSPDQSQSVDLVNRQLAAHFRPSVSLTNLISTR
jgi:hypothetical protein